MGGRNVRNGRIWNPPPKEAEVYRYKHDVQSIIQTKTFLFQSFVAFSNKRLKLAKDVRISKKSEKTSGVSLADGKWQMVSNAKY